MECSGIGLKIPPNDGTISKVKEITPTPSRGMRLKASSHTPRDDNNIFDNFLPVCVKLRTGRRLSLAKLIVWFLM